VLKPAESAPHVSSLLAELIPKYLDPELVAVVNGGIPETTRLLDLPWDHSKYCCGIYLTSCLTALLSHSSPLHWQWSSCSHCLCRGCQTSYASFVGVGRYAIFLVTLPPCDIPIQILFAGKSPVFIDPNCDIELAARRILWGKCVNAGQTCTAPDYILVPRDAQDKLVNALKDWYVHTYSCSCFLLMTTFPKCG
jgi:aldehyde dehydrogenase (NAD+)